VKLAWWVLGLAACSGGHAAPSPSVSASASLRLVEDGQPARTWTLADLQHASPAAKITVFDPYYQRRKTFSAMPLGPILAAAFPSRKLASEDLVLRATDGYAVPIRGDRLLEGGAYLAFRDEEVPGWEPIGPQHAHPGPFYLIWSGAQQTDLTTHPRPWALGSIEVVPFAKSYPHVAPLVAETHAQRGFGLFREHCLKCHAINREGGHVGPDLSLPHNIVEYRPEAEIRRYIRNPLAFRYGNMPPHPDLTDGDLDDLIAYLRAKSREKYDPADGKK